MTAPSFRNNSKEISSIDAVKGFWNRQPCNILHSRQPVGSKAYFEEVSERRYFVEPHIPEFARFNSWHGKKVLEIGCGIGTDTIEFAKAGAYVTAVDLSERSVEIARQRAAVYGLENRIRFIVGNIEELQKILPPEPYDLIYSFGVIHHTPNPERVVQQLPAFSHSQTQIKLMVYHLWSWKVIWILFAYGKGRFWELPRLVARYSEAQTGCPITYTYSKSSLVKMLRRADLGIVDCRVRHIFPYKIKEYKEYRYVKPWYFRILPKGLFGMLERVLGWHLCVTAIPLPEKGH